MADDRIVIQIELDDGTVRQGFLNIKKEADNAGEGIEQSLNKGVDSGSIFNKTLGDIKLSYVAVGLAAKEAFDIAFDFFTESVKQAADGEVSINRLNSALKNTSQFTHEGSSALIEFANSMEETTVFSDDAILSVESLLINIGRLSTQQVPQATQAVSNLATALRIDLDSAARLVAKGVEGHVEAFGRYGIAIEKGKTSSENLANILKVLNDRFAGSAARDVDTYSGSLAQLSNTFANLQKAIGQYLTSSPTVIAVIKVTSEIVSELTGAVKGAKGNFDLFNIGLQYTVNALGVLISVLKPLEILFNAVYFVISSLVTGVSALATGLLALYTGLIQVGNALHLISDAKAEQSMKDLNVQIEVLNKNANNTADSFNQISTTKFSDSLEDHVIDLNTRIIETRANIKGLAEDNQNKLPDGGTLDQITDKANNAAAATNGAIAAKEQLNQLNANETFAPNAGQNTQLGPEMPTFDQLGGTVLLGFQEALQGARNQMSAFAKSANDDFTQIGATATKTIGVGVANAFATFGRALAQGKNAGKAFLGALVSIFAQLAIQIGTQFILLGAAYSVSGIPPLEAKAGPLMAAGAALAAFGGVLSAIGGEGEGVGAGSAAHTAGNPEGPVLPTTDLNQLEQQKEKNQINVNIQGDVLDSKESGMRIVDLIRNYADINGSNSVVDVT